MSTTAQDRFYCEVVNAEDRQITTVMCHGRLVAGDTEGLRDAVHPLLEGGGRIAIDCSDLKYVDSMGLGALVALKVSSLHKGSGTVEFVNLTPRVKELLRITKLTEYLARPDTINYGD